MMQQNSLYELSGYIFNPFFMMGKDYPPLRETPVTAKHEIRLAAEIIDYNQSKFCGESSICGE